MSPDAKKISDQFSFRSFQRPEPGDSGGPITPFDNLNLIVGVIRGGNSNERYKDLKNTYDEFSEEDKKAIVNNLHLGETIYPPTGIPSEEYRSDSRTELPEAMIW